MQNKLPMCMRFVPSQEDKMLLILLNTMTLCFCVQCFTAQTFSSGFAQTSTMYLVVAVSAERFQAVCHPLAHRQPYYKFLAAAATCSAALELPRFFEFAPATEEDGTIDFETTPLMEDPDYIRLNSYWSELLATGALPLIALCYTNARIYAKIRASSRFARRFVSDGNRTSAVNSSNGMTSSMRAEGSKFEGRRLLRRVDEDSTVLPDRANKSSEIEIEREDGQKVSLESMGIKSQRLTLMDSPRPRLLRFSSERRDARDRRRISGEKGSIVELQLSSLSGANISSGHNSAVSMGATMRRRQERSAVVLVSIVLIFIVCHTYRLCLRVYELATPRSITREHYMACNSRGLYHIPVAFILLVSVHHLLLVANSSVNFIIFCCVGREFRAAVWIWWQRVLCCCRSRTAAGTRGFEARGIPSGVVSGDTHGGRVAIAVSVASN